MASRDPGGRVAVIGGGINGVMSAWALARSGYDVTLFERDRLMCATSSASSKLLHGGLRYLETGQFGLVREALHERQWWVTQAPQLAQPLPLLIPLYRGEGRRPWKLRLGLTIYDFLAGRCRFGPHRKCDAAEIHRLAPNLRQDNLSGGFLFFDAQMDDHALGLWAASQAERAGVRIVQQQEVERVDARGTLRLAHGSHAFDIIVNVAGPWAEQLLARSGLAPAFGLDLVRGSHIVLPFPTSQGMLVQAPEESRIVFILPYQGRTLIGTTEVRQTLNEPIACSEDETAYLLRVFNHYFTNTVGPEQIVHRFSGLRPLLKSHADPTQSSREYAVVRDGRLVSVFGGKWTTARCLGQEVARVVGKITPARTMP